MNLLPPFRDFAYRPATTWPPLRALGFALLLLIASAIGGALVAYSLVDTGDDPAAGLGDGAALIQLFVMQLLVVAGVLAAATWRGGSLTETLSLVPSATGGVATYVKAFLLVVVLTSAYTAVIWLIDPSILLNDLKPFARLIRSEWSPLAMLAVAIGAPVSEELLFRGFLFSALAASRVGIAGAVIITTVAWSALHAGYSVAGLIEVFMIGLVFCWLLLKTGSLWVPLVCHAVYNGLIMLVLKFAPIQF